MDQTEEIKAVLARANAIANKDVARLAGFVPACATILLALVDAEDPKVLQFVKEWTGVVTDFADERGVFGDPFKDERQAIRIFAQKWGLDAAYQQKLGVGPGTPADYDAAWKSKYLGA